MDRDDDEYDATVPVDACAAKRRLATKRLVAIDDIMMMMMIDDLSSVVCVDNFTQILTSTGTKRSCLRQRQSYVITRSGYQRKNC